MVWNQEKAKSMGGHTHGDVLVENGGWHAELAPASAPSSWAELGTMPPPLGGEARLEGKFGNKSLQFTVNIHHRSGNPLLSGSFKLAEARELAALRKQSSKPN